MVEIDIEELFDECLIIYEYNYEALVLHIYALILKSNKSVAKSKLMKDFKDKKPKILEKYRTQFVKVMDSFKDEINTYQEMTKFDIRGTHSALLYCYENLNNLYKVDNMTISRLEKELIKVIYYSERILDEISSDKMIKN